MVEQPRRQGCAVGSVELQLEGVRVAPPDNPQLDVFVGRGERPVSVERPGDYWAADLLNGDLPMISIKAEVEEVIRAESDDKASVVVNRRREKRFEPIEAVSVRRICLRRTLYAHD